MKIHKSEKEFQGPLWKHPYTLYVLATVALFGILLAIAWIAYSNGLIPNRGTIN